jgi:hypothetical protein
MQRVRGERREKHVATEEESHYNHKHTTNLAMKSMYTHHGTRDTKYESHVHDEKEAAIKRARNIRRDPSYSKQQNIKHPLTSSIPIPVNHS